MLDSVRTSGDCDEREGGGRELQLSEKKSFTGGPSQDNFVFLRAVGAFQVTCAFVADWLASTLMRGVGFLLPPIGITK